MSFKDSLFRDTRTHLLDLKTKKPGIGNSYILSQTSQKIYQTTMGYIRKELLTLGLYTDEIGDVLTLLQTSCNDFASHQIIRAKNLHLFPSRCIPPIRIQKNFNTDYFTTETLHQYHLAEVRIRKISNYLFQKGIPQTKKNELPPEAIDLFTILL